MIYLDFNATTPLCEAAREAMLTFLQEAFGNASSVHRQGQRARLAVERAREQVAGLLGAADPGEIVLTSGGTEALNLALRGAARALPSIPIVASAIEHQAVLHTAEDLERAGHAVRRIPVTPEGVVDLESLDRLLDGPALVAVMHANNEIGTLQPIEEVARRVAAKGGRLIVDAVQSAGKVEVRSHACGADYVAVSSHKIGGPQGAGALWVRRGAPLQALITGGPQERQRRGGTENVAAIAGFGAAAQEARERLPENARLMARPRDRIESDVVSAIPGARVLGAGAPRVPNTSAIVLPGVDAESLVMALDLEGICASTGAACASGSTEPSHVVKALGLPPELQRCCVRFSTGPGTTLEEVRRLMDVLPPIVERLRACP